MREWFRIAVRRDVVARGFKVAVIVGAVLTAINQGDVILAGRLDAIVTLKILLTFVVPYCVSTYAGVEAILRQQRESSGA